MRRILCCESRQLEKINRITATILENVHAFRHKENFTKLEATLNLVGSPTKSVECNA